MTWAEAGEATTGPAAGTPGLEPGRLAAGAERRVAVPPSVARQHLLRTIRELSFELRTEQLSVLEAVRGSKLGGVTLAPGKLPVSLRIGLEAADAGCRIAVLLADRWPGKVGRNWGATSAYVELFGAVLAAVDGALTRLDPSAAASFAPWWRDTGTGDVAIMQNAASRAAQAQAALSRHTSRLLDGGSAPPRGASVSRSGVDTFVFETADAVAEVPTELADGMLMVGTLVTSRPGAMPPALVAQVQSLVFRIEEHLAADGRASLFPATPEDVPVVTFLHQQARLRGLLPVRTLRTCTTCRLEKVTNPELERLQERTRRTRDLATGISAVVTPYVLAGRLVQLNSKGPEFACPRCQGLDADETVVTYCQRCGDRRAETALRGCPKCQFDFRSLLPAEQLWRPRTAGPDGGTVAGTGPSAVVAGPAALLKVPDDFPPAHPRPPKAPRPARPEVLPPPSGPPAT
ncbi:hypothetical protein [Polymorphospora sp. NPDC050346]|uniref:hypothetical protein n=1 Tax=Polymorphospora sp. NPDC050346 TaxID=3155780 RepID=UPI0033E36650